jgi:hypothetical protein
MFLERKQEYDLLSFKIMEEYEFEQNHNSKSLRPLLNFPVVTSHIGHWIQTSSGAHPASYAWSFTSIFIP